MSEPRQRAPSEAKPAIVLLSGGLDSTTVLAIAATEARQQVHALSFAYGQRHVVELGCAARQAERFGAVAHEVLELEQLGKLVAGASSLVASSPLSVPSAAEREHDQAIPSTYVPARNTLFLSYALAWAEVVGARDIWIGVNAVDYSGYPDCRPAFIEAFERTANLATRVGVEAAPGEGIRIHAPLIDLHKHEIIARGVALGVDYADTTSCYDPRERDGQALACGRCESCSLRRAGFVEAKIPDPTRYLPS
ncbi:MAG: 7-cyano-7-deazaguanine synthase QueC [Enhygromyxa sp.]